MLQSGVTLILINCSLYLTYLDRCVFLFRLFSLHRLYSNPANAAGTPCVFDLPVCDNHPAELSYWHGHVQAKVHWTALQAICIKGQLPDGYGTCAMSISLSHELFVYYNLENQHNTPRKGFCAIKITHLTCLLFRNNVCFWSECFLIISNVFREYLLIIFALYDFFPIQILTLLNAHINFVSTH